MSEKPLEQYYAPPPKLGRWEGFRVFLWNSETSQFLGRTAGSWAKILFFYVLFYALLTGFFFAMLAIFYQTIDSRVPKWQLEDSLIGNNPGLGFRPMPPADNVESTLIWYRASGNNHEFWTKQLDKFLEEYEQSKPSAEGEATEGERGRVVVCGFREADRRAEGKQVCVVDLGQFGNCTHNNSYGYHRSQPCIFLKLNKIFNWVPEFYNASSTLPKNMPEDLQKHIRGLNSTQREAGSTRLNTVWVSCEGENPADVENIGPIQYQPYQGFPGYYFPFQNYKGYMSPLVAVQFTRPKPGVLINIECKAWAKNIQHDRAERRGSVHFELMIDE